MITESWGARDYVKLMWTVVGKLIKLCLIQIKGKANCSFLLLRGKLEDVHCTNNDNLDYWTVEFKVVFNIKSKYSINFSWVNNNRFHFSEYCFSILGERLKVFSFFDILLKWEWWIWNGMYLFRAILSNCP